MKKYILIIITAIAALSCSEIRDVRFVCTCQEQARAAEFVANNIKGANNMSDEEMEDVIAQLHRTAVKLKCHQEQFIIERGPFTVDWTDERNHIDSCEVVMEHIY